MAAAHNNTESIWIFGYGSLVHTPNFDYSQKVIGYIRGYRRVFWQGSTDHRGTPQRPGRTVTLAADHEPDALTWGAAFQLAGTPDEQAATLSYLEWREKQYDVRHRVDVYDKDGTLAVAGALVYIASPANSNYLGPASLGDIAAQIATSRGPSGPNAEYLFRLADAMRSVGVHDPELFALEDMVRQELARRAADLQEKGVLGEEAEAAHTMVLGEVVEELEHHVDFRRRHQLTQDRAQRERARQDRAQNDQRVQQECGQQHQQRVAAVEQGAGDGSCWSGTGYGAVNLGKPGHLQAQQPQERQELPVYLLTASCGEGGRGD